MARLITRNEARAHGRHSPQSPLNLAIQKNGGHHCWIFNYLYIRKLSQRSHLWVKKWTEISCYQKISMRNKFWSKFYKLLEITSNSLKENKTLILLLKCIENTLAIHKKYIFSLNTSAFYSTEMWNKGLKIGPTPLIIMKNFTYVPLEKTILIKILLQILTYKFKFISF